MGAAEKLSALRAKLDECESQCIVDLDALHLARRNAHRANYSPDTTKATEEAWGRASKTAKELEKLFKAAEQEHVAFWRQESDKQLKAARAALVPLARAYMIETKAKLGPIIIFRHWLEVKLANPGFLFEELETVAHEAPPAPLEPPTSFALVRADDEI